MKVLAVVFIAFASASAKGSGPYLPSGWRPEGPAFYLPSEVVKPSEAPVKDLTLQGSEASGSDFLQEYGPPKVQEISQNLINQGLPDVATELSFGAVQNAAPISEIAPEQVSEVKPITSTEQSEIETESQAPVEAEPIVSVEVPVAEVEELETTSASAEPTTELSSASSSNEGVLLENQQESSTVLSELEAVISTTVDATTEDLSANTVPATDEQILEQNVQNIPQIIANLEQEILTQQAEVNQAVSELAVPDVSGALQQAPEGFLEYGPPGFAEYGPPKGEDKAENIQPFASTEVRRRRFSPKFRPARKQ